MGQAGAGDTRDKSDERHAHSGQIRSESPDITGTDPGGSPPRTARNDTHRSVDSGSTVAEGLRASSEGCGGRVRSAEGAVAAALECCTR